MKKMTFRQWIENYWYHYKFTTIVVVFFLFFISISVAQMISKKSPDANVVYMGRASISFTSQGKLQESFANVMKKDYNNDGKKSVDYLELTVLDPKKAQNFDKTTYTSHQVDEAAGERFVAELVAGDSMIYLAEEKYYKMAREQDLIMPLDEILGFTPEKALDKYSIYLKDLDIFYLDGFNKLPSDTILFVRYPVSLADSKKELENREKNNLSVFKDMIEYIHPDKPEDKISVAKRVSDDEFLLLYKDWCNSNNVIPPESPDLAELTTEEIFKETGATIYKCESKTFLIFDNKLYSIGRANDKMGVCDFDTCDFDNNGVLDFIFTYTYFDEQYSAKASVFNITTLRETPLNIGDVEEDRVLLLEKISNSHFKVWKSEERKEDLTSSLSANAKEIEICELLAEEGNIYKKSLR